MPSPGGILSFDLSLSSTGFSYGCLGERPVFGSFRLGKMVEPGAAYATLEDRADELITNHQPRHVVYEAPLPTHRKIDKNNPGAARSTNEIAITLIRLGGIIELITERHRLLRAEEGGAPLNYFHQSCTEARRKVLGSNPTGKTEEVKAKIMKWARDRGWMIANDDESDALLLLQYAVVIKDQTSKAHFFKQGEIL